ncbi:MAG: energy-coupling factor ABC transporter ATP-binding protein, partial [Clostridiaceae bacterium]|nr:energy-coupling factor ABC transporter ATP-binding protein [Clostridiaceae bacterium]
ILILSKGEIAFSGSKRELYNDKNKELQLFLPNYLKISKDLNIANMPYSLRDARRVIEEFTYEYEPSLLDKNLTNKEELIRIENLSCKYDENLVIKDLNTSIKQGEFIGIMGANGGGKTTFLKSLMGLIKYSGSVKVNLSGQHKEIKKLKIKDIARIIGYISQNPNDYISKETVFDELKFTLDNYNIKDYQVIEDTLKALDIYKLKNKNPRDLSGGEIQRVAIASILVLKPKILLLDEPTRGLDSKVKTMLGEILHELNKNGTTIILVTHDVEFASEFCSRFLLMFNGEIVGDGTCQQVLGTGIYYTTTINKIFRNRNSNIFTLKDFAFSEVHSNKSNLKVK